MGTTILWLLAIGVAVVVIQYVATVLIFGVGMGLFGLGVWLGEHLGITSLYRKYPNLTVLLAFFAVFALVMVLLGTHIIPAEGGDRPNP